MKWSVLKTTGQVEQVEDAFRFIETVSLEIECQTRGWRSKVDRDNAWIAFLKLLTGVAETTLRSVKNVKIDMRGVVFSEEIARVLLQFFKAILSVNGGTFYLVNVSDAFEQCPPAQGEG